MDVVNVTENVSNNMIGISWYDYFLFGLMLGLSALIGIYFGFFGDKQDTAEEYLLGNKKMNVIPIAVSLTASNISGITILAVPTDVYQFGATYILYASNMLPLFFVTYYIYLPVFYKLQLTSTYEYLKLRFDKRIQLLASFIFTLSNVLYLPIVIYVPALAISQVCGVSLYLITPIVCGICIFYTTIGGLKAVVWTDTLQFFVMMGSLIAVFYLGLNSVGGFEGMWKKSLEGERLEFDFNFDPTVRDTVPAIVTGTLFSGMSYCSIGQGFVQKYLSLPKITDVKKALIGFCFMMVIILTYTILTGLIIYAKYSDCDPFTAGMIVKKDQILPYYVMDVASVIPGLSGLFVSGIVSASLSTLSAFMNCLAGSFYEDFVRPFMPEDITEKQTSNILKFIVLMIGAISTILVFVIPYLGTIFALQYSLSGITYGGILGLFTLGMLFPMANAKGALYGGIGSLILMSIIILGSQIYKTTGILQHPTKPISIEGCNMTINNTFEEVEDRSDEVFFLFKITHYLYIYLGTILVIIIGLIVSFFTKDENHFVKKDYISPVSHWMYNKRNVKRVKVEENEAINLLKINKNVEIKNNE